MKKIITVTTILLLSSLFLTYNLYNKENISNTKINKNSNMLSIMLETEVGSGNYEVSDLNTWPKEGYVYNEFLSNCENNTIINWSDETKSLSLKGNKTDKCYIYFDIYVEPATFANYIKNLYTGIQGENNIYYHDSSLENGAGDNSYRYAGENPNNYVCFGSEATTCPNDNLYRIIGVFDGRVKLIKADYATGNLLGTDGDYKDAYSYDSSNYKGNLSVSNIGDYMWNYNGLSDHTGNNANGSNTWSTSLLNKTNLNTNYLNNIGSKWISMIDTTTWKVGGNIDDNIRSVVPSVAYQNEIINPANNTTYNAKIGLMYITDYGFAASPSSWTKTLYNYGTGTTKNENWMYLGLNEWTITPSTSINYNVVYITYTGHTFVSTAKGTSTVRPVFYLNSKIRNETGSGTRTDPYRIME